MWGSISTHLFGSVPGVPIPSGSRRLPPWTCRRAWRPLRPRRAPRRSPCAWHRRRRARLLEPGPDRRARFQESVLHVDLRGLVARERGSERREQPRLGATLQFVAVEEVARRVLVAEEEPVLPGRAGGRALFEECAEGRAPAGIIAVMAEAPARLAACARKPRRPASLSFESCMRALPSIRFQEKKGVATARVNALIGTPLSVAIRPPLAGCCSASGKRRATARCGT